MRAFKGRVAFGPVCVVALLSACGGGDEAPTADNVGQKFAAAACAAKSRCCQARGTPLSQKFMSACLSEEALVPYEPSAFTSDMVFNPDMAQRCISAAANYDCSHGLGDACFLVFSGGAPPGGSCTTAVQCAQAPGANALCENGTCVAATLFQGAGAPCPHGDPMECDGSKGIWCKPGATVASSVCAAPLQTGDSCAAGFAICASGSYCTPIPPQVCAPRAAMGDACDANAVYSSCVPPGQCTNAVCAPPADDGECLSVSL